MLLSSHILSEVEKVCDTVTIIRTGAGGVGHAGRAAPPDAHGVTAVVGADPARLAALPGVHDLRHTAPTAPGSRSTPTTRRSPRSFGARHDGRAQLSPRPRRRWRSCSCVTTATAWMPIERRRPGRRWRVDDHDDDASDRWHRRHRMSADGVHRFSAQFSWSRSSCAATGFASACGRLRW